MSNRISTILLFTLIALVALIAVELKGGLSPDERIAAAAAKEREAAAPQPVRLSLPPLSSLSETVNRPLFIDNRRPPEDTAEAAPAIDTPRPAGTATSFSVSAIIVTEKERAVLLSYPQSGGLTRVAEGEMVAGWRLEKVENDRAIFEKDGETREAALRSFGPPPPPRARPESDDQRRNALLQRALRDARQRQTAPPQDGEPER